MLVASLLAYAGFVFSHALWVPPMVARINECDPCASLGEIRFLAGYLLAVSCLPSAVCAWQFLRHWRAGQIPRPQARVMFRTRVWTGAWYHCQLLMFGLAALLALYIPLLLWRELPFLTIFVDSGC